VAAANLLSDLIDACVRRPEMEAAAAALPAAAPRGGKRPPPGSPLGHVVPPPPPVLSGHAASLPRTNRTRRVPQVAAVEGLLAPRFHRTLHCTLCVVQAPPLPTNRSSPPPYLKPF